MSNNDQNHDYTRLPEDKLKKLSRLFLSYHVDCLQQQRDMKLTDSEISCKAIFNEHFWGKNCIKKTCSGSGSVGRTVASGTRGTQFESSHWQN